MKLISILVVFIFTIGYTQAQNDTTKIISIGINPITIPISDGFSRSNGFQICPIISAHLDKLTLSTGPLLSINNASTYKNIGSCGFVTIVDFRLSKKKKKLSYGFEYILSWQRYINKTTKHYNKGNYSLAGTFGYYISYALNKKIFLTHGAGIGTGYGATSIAEEKSHAYKGTAFHLKIGLDYRL